MPANREIPLTVQAELQEVRLVELTPELEAIASGKVRLFLKSSDLENGFAVLCSDSATFTIREVQSSNSVYLTQDQTTSPNRNVAATALCKSFLECTLAKPNIDSLLNENIPEITQALFDADEFPVGQSKFDTEDLLDLVPCSEGELSAALIQNCVFKWNQSLVRPSPQWQLACWQQMLVAGTLAAVDMTRPFPANVLTAEVEQLGFPTALTTALVKRIYENEDSCRDTAILWTASTLLRTIDPSQGLTRDKFLGQWQPLLPEKWKSDASLEAIKSLIYEDASGNLKPLSSKSIPNHKMHKWHQKLSRAK